MATPKSQTKDGLELTMGTNHFGHFLLTNLLLDQLKASAPSRIVHVSSNAHQFVFRLNRNDWNSERSYNRWFVYCQSKLANILFSRALAKRLEGTGVTTNSLHPGCVNTELLRYNSITRIILAPIIHLFFKTPEAGAQTTIKVAVDPDLANVTGRYFSNCRKTVETNAAQSEDSAEWLWQLSESVTGLQA